MLSPKVLEAWIQRIDDTASAKISGNAQDITELARRIEAIEKLQNLDVQDIGTLRDLLSALAGNVEILDEKQCRVAHLTDRLFTQQRGLPELARHIKALTERIEKLEERED